MHRDHTEHKITGPTVSIGMPVYNGEKYIREAIDSLLAQSHTEFELIISDNSSTDGTEAICKEYLRGDTRISYFRQNENRGPLANFKFVLDQAESNYFMWAAADDVWDTRWISEMLGTIRNSNAQAAFGTIECIDENSEKFDHDANGSTFDYRAAPLVRQLKYFLEFEGAGKANPIYGIWRTDILRSIDLKAYQFDYLIVFDLLKTAKVAGCLDAKLYKRFHLQSEGGPGIEPVRPGIAEKVRLLLTNLIRPFPEQLLEAYYSSAGRAKLLFVAMTPIKYLVAYWFHVTSKISTKLVA